MCWECATIVMPLQRTNLAVMNVRRSMPTVDNELLSLRRWQLFSELSFLTRPVAQLALSRTLIQVVDEVNQGNFEGEE